MQCAHSARCWKRGSWKNWWQRNAPRATRATEAVAGVMMTVADAVTIAETVVADQDRIPSRALPNPSPPLQSPSLKNLPKQQRLLLKPTQLLNNQQEMTAQTRTAQQRPD